MRPSFQVLGFFLTLESVTVLQFRPSASGSPDRKVQAVWREPSPSRFRLLFGIVYGARQKKSLQPAAEQGPLSSPKKCELLQWQSLICELIERLQLPQTSSCRRLSCVMKVNQQLAGSL